MIRTTLVFLFAALLGALTVSGQDDPVRGLEQRIRALTEELRARADRRAPEDAAGKPVRRFYEAGDLALAASHAAPWGEAVLIPSNYSPPEGMEVPEPVSPFVLDSIVEIIRQVIEPETWDAVVGASIEVADRRLIVTNLPRVHRKVEALLAMLRRASDRQLRIEVVAVPMQEGDAALLAGRPRELTDEEAAALLDRAPLGSALLRGRSGQMVRQEVGRDVSYLQDYEVEIAQEATIGDPIRQQAFEGFRVHVDPLLDDDAPGARLDLRIDLTRLTRPIPAQKTAHGPLDLPQMELTRLRTSLWAPLGKVVVAGGATVGGNPCLFLVRADRDGG